VSVPLLRFVGALRAAGMSVDQDRVLAAARAVAGLPDDVYWALRVALCRHPTDLPIFDRVFRGLPEADERTTANAAGAPELGNGGADEAPTAGDETEAEGAGSTGELTVRDYELLTEVERDQIRAWISELVFRPPTHRVMRHEVSRTGRVDVPRTMRLLLRNHGELSAIRFHRRAARPRRVLLLVDVSRSMGPYTDLYLRFAHAALAASPRHTEVFTVGTRHTRLTGHLWGAFPDAALRAAAAVRNDWGHGTTLGVVLQDFLCRWGGRNVVRSAVVVLASDGFEFDDQTLLRRQAERLSRLASTFIWVDPNRRTDDFVPGDPNLAAAQAAATVRLPGHNFEALRQLAKEIGR
jgi:uncharacterized protein with von Willebrand factor type A (vWA) domain